MITQQFYLDDYDWNVCVYYNVATPTELDVAYSDLVAAGMTLRKACRAVCVLASFNSGYTHTDFGRRTTLMFMSKTTSPEQMYDSIQHETRHAADHIGECFGMPARGEDSAYLQGEIARKMFPAATMVTCPKCNHHDNHTH